MKKILFLLLELALLPIRALPRSIQFQIAGPVIFSLAGRGRSFKYWAAVARHETGQFQNSFFLKANNPFSMGVAKVREKWGVIGTHSGASETHAKYFSIVSALVDLQLYLSYNSWIDTDFPDGTEGIPAFSAGVAWQKQKGYFEAPIGDYLKGVLASRKPTYPAALAFFFAGGSLGVLVFVAYVIRRAFVGRGSSRGIKRVRR